MIGISIFLVVPMVKDEIDEIRRLKTMNKVNNNQGQFLPK